MGGNSPPKIIDNNNLADWDLEKFNSLPLIHRITIYNQVNRIIKAFRYYMKRKRVS